MGEFVSIKKWNEEEQPREKMLRRGASALTDAELLAILVTTGTVNKSALDLGREVLDLADRNLRQLGRLNITELQKVNGIGQAKAITIAAAMELGRRRQLSESLERTAIHKSREAAEYLMPLLQDLNHEAFCVLYLSHSNKLLRHEIISNGGMTGTTVDTRIVLKNCLLNNSNQIIIAHNHPSGSLRPSEADKLLTVKIRDAAALMDIKLLDHVIIGNGDFLSMSDEGLF